MAHMVRLLLPLGLLAAALPLIRAETVCLDSYSYNGHYYESYDIDADSGVDNLQQRRCTEAQQEEAARNYKQCARSLENYYSGIIDNARRDVSPRQAGIFGCFVLGGVEDCAVQFLDCYPEHIRRQLTRGFQDSFIRRVAQRARNFNDASCFGFNF